MSFQIKPLPYDYNAFDEYIDARTMEIHYTKHHQGYINNLNNAIKDTEADDKSLLELLQNVSQYSATVRNNAGGHYNHGLFWELLSATPALAPSGELKAAIEAKWGSLDAFREVFNKAAATRFGSGWAWLYVDANGGIEVCSTPNQDNPIMDLNTTGKGAPILGLDVWEHAYYLKYQNRRPDYINAFWHVLDWKAVEKNYAEAIK